MNVVIVTDEKFLPCHRLFFKTRPGHFSGKTPSGRMLQTWPSESSNGARRTPGNAMT